MAKRTNCYHLENDPYSEITITCELLPLHRKCQKRVNSEIDPVHIRTATTTKGRANKGPTATAKQMILYPEIRLTYELLPSHRKCQIKGQL